MLRTILTTTMVGMAFVCIDAAAQSSPAWQQQVHYKMDITLKADEHKMFGTQWLTYVNNSPDTLATVYYHLYFNAFDPSSMMAERNRHLPDPDSRIVPRIWELNEDEVGYHRIRSISQNGVRLGHELSDTVLKVDLNEPILPGASTNIKMVFASQVPLQTRRSGRDSAEGVDYSMSQWYPKIAAYDGRGWHTDPYVGREFYAPFGTFDVTLRLPANYIVGATGVLQNPNEIGHGYQTDNSMKFPHSSSDSLEWNFVAENVHDFAWVADTDYIHEMFDGEDGVTYHLLYLKDVEDRWTTMRDRVPAVIQSLSRQVGAYPYPQFTVAQAGDGGMEYPMINFITGRRSENSLLGVTAHEAAHEWFYGVLGSNEADYSWMDEGFTTFTSSRAINEVLGMPPPQFSGLLQSIVVMQQYGAAERLSTPADWFETNSAFSVASYTGGAMIADMLGYVMSDDLRDQWLQEYYRRYTFKHPNPYDVEKVAEDVSGMVLDWFFEQFTNTTRTLDYGINSLRSFRRGDVWASELVIERHDETVLPVDVCLTLEDGSHQYVTIPLGIMQGHKPVDDDWIVARDWHWTSPVYTLYTETPVKVTAAAIDPFVRTPDYNRLNNSTGFPRETRLFYPPRNRWSEYSIGYRPLVDYAFSHGIGIGFDARGQYFLNNHISRATIKVWPEILADPGNETRLDGIDWHLEYNRIVGIPGNGLRLFGSVAKHVGIMENRLGIEKTFGGFVGGDTDKTLTITLGNQFRESNRGFNGTIDALYGRLWTSGNILSGKVEFEADRGMHHLAAGVEVGGPIDNPGDASANLFGSRATMLSLEIETGKRSEQLFAILSGALEVGNSGLAFQKRRILGSAPLEEQWRNPAARSLSAALFEDLDDLQFSPVSNRGPIAYLMGDFFGSATPSGFGASSGSNLLAFNAETGLEHGPTRGSVFAGIGQVWDNIDTFETDRFLADAGIGVHVDVSEIDRINRWTAQSGVLSNLKLSARFPFWVSDPQIFDPDENKFEFRWLIGVAVDY